MAHGGPEVERPLAPVAALAGQADRQLARQGVDGAAQRRQLVARGVHEVDLLGQGLAQRPGQRLGAAIGHEPAADLVLEFPAQPVEAGLELVAGQALFQGRELSPGGLGPSRLHQSLQDPVEVEVP